MAPVLKPREAISILVALGFEEVRQRGSHKQFRHADGRATTVPVHRGRDVSPILLQEFVRGQQNLPFVPTIVRTRSGMPIVDLRNADKRTIAEEVSIINTDLVSMRSRSSPSGSLVMPIRKPSGNRT